MDALLEKIVLNTEKIARNTEPKESYSILLSERSSQIRTKFSPLIQLDKSKRYEMALVNLETYNSFPNIDSSNNNCRYSPDKCTTWFNINRRYRRIRAENHEREWTLCRSGGRWRCWRRNSPYINPTKQQHFEVSARYRC